MMMVTMMMQHQNRSSRSHGTKHQHTNCTVCEYFHRQSDRGRPVAVVTLSHQLPLQFSAMLGRSSTTITFVIASAVMQGCLHSLVHNNYSSSCESSVEMKMLEFELLPSLLENKLCTFYSRKCMPTSTTKEIK